MIPCDYVNSGCHGQATIFYSGYFYDNTIMLAMCDRHNVYNKQHYVLNHWQEISESEYIIITVLGR